MNDKELKNYFIIPHSVLEDQRFKKLKSSVKVVFLYLAKYRNRFQNELFYRTIKNICLDTNLSKATVIEAKKILIKNNFLYVKKIGNYALKSKASDEYSIEFLFEVIEALNIKPPLKGNV